MEEFYELYGYESDEQSILIQTNCVGVSDVPQETVIKFAETFGAPILMKKISKPKKK